MIVDKEQKVIQTAVWKWYTWPEFYSPEQCKTISDFLDENWSGTEDPITGAKDKYGVSKKQIKTVKTIEYGKVKHLVGGLVNHAYHHAQHSFGYDMFGPTDHETLLWNTYSDEDKDFYTWHFDESNNAVHDIKLSLLINLSPEPFEGGEFQTYCYDIDEHPDYNKSGSAIMFKSHFNHRVLPVTKGTRKTLAMFMCGPRFR